MSQSNVDITHDWKERDFPSAYGGTFSHLCDGFGEREKLNDILKTDTSETPAQTKAPSVFF